MNIRKSLCAALAAITICGLTACGDSDGGASKSSEKEKTSEASNRYDENDDENAGSSDEEEEDGDNAGNSANSKQDSANAAASSLSKAASSAMMDIENKDGEDVSGTYWLTGKNIGAKGETLEYGGDMKLSDLGKFSEYIHNYFDNLDKAEEAGCYFVNGTCVGAYVKLQNGYFGAYPSSLVTAKENKKRAVGVEDCVERIEDYVADEYGYSAGADEEDDDENGGGSSYDSNTKQTTADSAASALSKAGSTAMIEVECKMGDDLSGTYWLTGKNIGAAGETLDHGGDMKLSDLEAFAKYIHNYFLDIDKCEEAGCYFVDGSCVGAYVKLDSGYFGTFPSMLVTPEDNEGGAVDVWSCAKRIEDYAAENY